MISVEKSSQIKGFSLWVLRCSHFVRLKTIKGLAMKLIQKRNLKQWERWRRFDIKSSMLWGGLRFGFVSSGPGWLAALDEIGSTFPLCWTGLYWCRKAKALGLFWLSFGVVMPHIISAEHSEASRAQQGHDLPRVTRWVTAEVGRESELQTAEHRVLLTRKVILSMWEGKIVLNRQLEIDSRWF